MKNNRLHIDMFLCKIFYESLTFEEFRDIQIYRTINIGSKYFMVDYVNYQNKYIKIAR